MQKTTPMLFEKDGTVPPPPLTQFFETSAHIAHVLATLSWFPDLMSRGDVRTLLTVAGRRIVNFWKAQEKRCTRKSAAYRNDVHRGSNQVLWAHWANELATVAPTSNWRQARMYGKHVRV